MITVVIGKYTFYKKDTSIEDVDTYMTGNSDWLINLRIETKTTAANTYSNKPEEKLLSYKK